MAGPTLAIREQCPLATPTNDGLMSAEQAAQLSDEQTLTFSFTGAQDYLESLWPEVFASFRLSFAYSAAGGAIVSFNLTKFGDGTAEVDNTGVRVVPSIPFTGKVWVTSNKI